MALTLAEAKVGMADKVDQNVIDLVQRNSAFMNALTFDDAVAPGTGGSTLTYGYIQTTTPASAAGRAINSEYTAQEAKKTKKTVDLQIMGGSFAIDRVIAKNSNKRNDEVTYQIKEKTKATVSRFQYLAINGNKSTTNEFDGLTKLLANTENEIDASSVDCTGAMTEAKAEALCEALDEAINSLDGPASMILVNTKTKVKLIAAARLLNYFSQSRDEFGRSVDKYGDTPIVDMKQYYNGTGTVDVIATTTPTTTAFGKADIYVVRLGLDGLHGVTPQGGVGIDTILPDFSQEGAVHKGEVEMVGAIALKSTKAAAVLRNVAILPKASA